MTRLSIFMLVVAVAMIAFALYQVTAENYAMAGLFAGLGLTFAGIPAVLEALVQNEGHDDAG